MHLSITQSSQLQTDKEMLCLGRLLAELDLKAQEKGKNDWYSWYHVRICKVEHEYGFGL